MASDNSKQEKKPFQHLSPDVVPVNYALRLKPRLVEPFDFHGSLLIDILVKKSVNTITLNSSELTIKEVIVDGDSAKISSDEENETSTFTFSKPLAEGAHKLSIEYTGVVAEKLRGFYRSHYKRADGSSAVAAVTQFEPTDARRALPCWDEPSFKASFDVTLVTPQDRTALSNMNVIHEEPASDESGWKVVTFARTPIMSTYLLCFIVGEYDYVETKDENGVIVRVYTPLGKKEQGNFALHVASKTLPFYKRYFNIAYPLQKCDLIAIADFSSGAMENWGMITYRETALLISPESSAAMKQRVALVVGHELAHQWFGNLVTMEWWTHLWLNEGFASWIEYLCVDDCFPEYDIWTQFVSMTLAPALHLDALKSSHPIEVPVGHPSEIEEIFDDISYEKGSSIIRMLHNFIGDKAFREGLNSYLTKHQYANAITEQLWAAIEASSGHSVTKIMSGWTAKMGYPVITVESVKCEGKKRVLQLSQTKFNADGSKDESGSTWCVPLLIGSTKNPTPENPHLKFLLEKTSDTITLENLDENDWITLNAGAVGVYRVHYTKEMCDALMPAIRERKLPTRDRFIFVDDLFALARAGLTSTAEVVRLMEAFTNEDSYAVWNAILSNLAKVSLLLEEGRGGNGELEALDMYFQSLLVPIASKIGWEATSSDTHQTALLRGLVLGKLGRSGHEATVAKARQLFKAHCEDPKQHAIPADIRAAVYSIVNKFGDQTTLDQMLKLHRESDSQEEKTRIQRTIGHLPSEELLNKALTFAMSDEVRTQDTVFIIGAMTISPLGRTVAWKFYQDNFAEIQKRYSGVHLMAFLCEDVTNGFASEERASEIEAFFASHEEPNVARTVQQSLETVRLNARQLALDGQSIINYLLKR